ncbi:hypothetical protein GCM10011371_11300 [Novosphingobium marinum]|uniref:Uncharacterized protein n=1 Tax=Novosphingobium marinum TaxID=1514948 RepID=A0A7Z0BTJ1_9SPHN|nr:hypothetical protein [Novosphingobium marinum]NYH95239.1 hypothetical protein [Novosphingobium marinum]GGC25439.1 hypothetical protein GCM10011371_11300 [Novosphingobium marinum]
MASEPPKAMVPSVQAPQHFVPPTGREMRTQAVHRLQVGLLGLCAMLLLVGLANIVMDRARLVEERDPVEEIIAAQQEEAKKPATDPLADIGVVPAADPSATPEPVEIEPIEPGPVE